MPYIDKERRTCLDPKIKELTECLKDIGFGKGDMNYVMSKLAVAFVKMHGKSYGILSDVTGVFNDAKVEFERRVVAPYEDEKIKQNGDVY